MGSAGFKAEMARENRRAEAALARGDRQGEKVREAVRQERLDRLLKEVKQTRKGLEKGAKMAAWKVVVAAAMKASTTATNRWLAEHLHMGSLHEVSRRVAALQRETTIHKA